MTTDKKSKKGKRECGFCHAFGHNQRTCEKKKAAEAANGTGAPLQAVPQAPASSPMGRVEVEIEVAPAISEFEEQIKQVVVHGTTLRLAMRDAEGGIVSMHLQVQPAKGRPIDLQFDHDTCNKLVELLTWGAQRSAIRHRALPVRSSGPNGVSATTVAVAAEAR